MVNLPEKRKPRKPKPALRKRQKVLTDLDAAKRQLKAVSRLKGGKAKFVALTNLLSRAYKSKRPNPEVIQLIMSTRSKIPIKWPGEKPFKGVPKEKPIGALNENTSRTLHALKQRLTKKNLAACNDLVHFLVTDTPKAESGMVANQLESMARQAEAKWLKNPKLTANVEYAKTIIKIYSASGELYKTRGMMDKAEDLFNAADILKARHKHGF